MYSLLASLLFVQVPQRGDYILQDKTTLDTIRELALKFDPMKLSHVLRSKRSGLITAGSQGVWLAMDFKNVLQACRGNVQGTARSYLSLSSLITCLWSVRRRMNKTRLGPSGVSLELSCSLEVTHYKSATNEG